MKEKNSEHNHILIKLVFSMKRRNLLVAGLLVAGMSLGTSCSDDSFVAATPEEEVTPDFGEATLALVNESG